MDGAWWWARSAGWLADVAPFGAGEAAGPGDLPAAVRAAGALVEADPARALDEAARVTAAAAAANRADLEGKCRLIGARALVALGRPAEALEVLGRLEAEHAAAGAGAPPVLALVGGEALTYLAALDEAVERFERALAAFDAAGDDVGGPRALVGLARVHWARDDEAGTRGLLDRALEAMAAAGDRDPAGRVHALNLLGLVLWVEGHRDRALGTLASAERLAAAEGCALGAGLAVVNRGLLLIDMDRFGEAEAGLAASAAGPLGANPRARCGIEHALGRLEMRRGHPAAAEAHLRRAVEVGDAAGMPAFALPARQDLADCMEAQGRMQEALALLRQAHEAEREVMGAHGEQRRWAMRLQREAQEARAEHERLSRDRDELEARVAERTERLTDTLHALREEMDARERAQAQLRHLARHDGLTGLPNRGEIRATLRSALDRAADSGERVAVLVIDLDGFKHVNDTLGHPVGDRVIRAAADRLAGTLAGPVAIGRVGGDEFLVVMPGCVGRRDADALAARLRHALEPPLLTGGLRFHVGATVGIAMFPEDGADEEALLRAADLALYAGKAAGRGRIAFFAPGMEADSRRRMDLQGALPGAVRRSEMEARFQPRVRADDGTMVALEALARWHHPRLGDVPPGEFIPVAEDTGEIQVIGEWMLQRAVEMAARIADAGHPEVRVSVNASALQVVAPGFADAIRAALAVAGVPPRRLEVELTESAELGPGSPAAGVLGELRAEGVRVALDDFGTGFANLSHLARLPVDRIKLDVGLVRDVAVRPGHRTLVAAVVGLARDLGLSVTAEGVEDPDQAAVLRELGCEELQGFGIALPLAADDVVARLAPGALRTPA